MRASITQITLVVMIPLLNGCNFFNSSEKECAEAAIAVANTTEKVNSEFAKGSAKNQSNYSAWTHAYYQSLKWHDLVCKK
jgi:alpha-D-ribose 1-methylphosphonate 5-triphosphate synthase subunit PhnG